MKTRRSSLLSLIVWSICFLGCFAQAEDIAPPMTTKNLTDERYVRGCIAAYKTWERIHITAYDGSCDCLGPQPLRVIIQRDKAGLHACVSKTWSELDVKEPKLWFITNQDVLHLKKKLVSLFQDAVAYEWKPDGSSYPGVEKSRSPLYSIHVVFTFAGGAHQSFSFKGGYDGAVRMAKHCAKPGT